MNYVEDGVYYFYVGDVLCLADAEDQELIDSMPLRVDSAGIRRMYAPTRLIKRMVLGLEGQKAVVRHKNGIKTDIRKSNLTIVSREECNKNAGRGLHMTYNGKALGVNLFRSNGKTFWVAQVGSWRKGIRKQFSVDKYGYDEALKKAIKWRCAQVEKLGGWKEHQADYDAWGSRTTAEFYG